MGWLSAWGLSASPTTSVKGAMRISISRTNVEKYGACPHSRWSLPRSDPQGRGSKIIPLSDIPRTVSERGGAWGSGSRVRRDRSPSFFGRDVKRPALLSWYPNAWGLDGPDAATASGAHHCPSSPCLKPALPQAVRRLTFTSPPVAVKGGVLRWTWPTEAVLALSRMSVTYASTEHGLWTRPRITGLTARHPVPARVSRLGSIAALRSTPTRPRCGTLGVP
jgi:hypothetical protein